MSLTLAKKDVVAMFQKLGRKAAGDWDDKKLAKKIKNIKTDMEDVEIPKELSTADSILTKILDAQEKGEKIVLSDGESTEKEGKGKDKKGKNKDGKGKDKGGEKKEKGAKIGRLQASAMAIKAMKSKGADKDELIDAADAIYVKHGGTANKGQASWATKTCLVVMEAWGMIEVDGNQVRMKKEG